MRGQSSIEYLSIVGVALVILVAISMFVSVQISNTRNENQARYAVNQIGRLVNEVCSLAHPSKQSVFVMFPDNISENSYIGSETGVGNVIDLKVYSKSGESDVPFFVDCNVTGDFNFTPGYKKIYAKTTPVGIVEVGEE